MESAILRTLYRTYKRYERDADFVDLTHQIEGFGGDSMWMLAEELTAWPALSEDAVRALEDLLVTRQVRLTSVDHSYYLALGVKSTLRLATTVRVCAELTWLPCVLGEGLVKRCERCQALFDAFRGDLCEPCRKTARRRR